MKAERCSKTWAMARRMVREARRCAVPTDPTSPALAKTWRVDDLLQAHGDGSMAVVLMVLAMVTVLPIAGVGTMLSGAIVLWAWAWLRHREGMPGFDRIAQLPLPSALAQRSLRGLARLHLLRSRWFKPRFQPVFAPLWRWCWALWVVCMALVIFLPLPLGNVLPALSLLILGLALMARDGVAMLLSLVPGLAGLALLLASLDLVLAVLQRLWT